MLVSVQVRNEHDVLLGTLPVFSASLDSQYLVKDIEGVDPVAAELSMSNYVGFDGGLIQGSRTGPRNLVFKIGYRPDWLSNQTVKTLRRELYQYFPPKGTVKLRFIDDDGIGNRTITGVVESHETSIFSKDPEVTISVVCPDPDFKALSNSVISGFLNTEVPISYFGTAATGFVLDLFPNRSFGQIFINNFVDQELYLQGGLVAGETLRVSTVRGNKYIRVIRDGVSVNSLDYINTGTLGLTLNNKLTKFEVRGSGSADVPFRLTYTPGYIGI